MTYESALKVIQEAEKHSDIYTKINITVKNKPKEEFVPYSYPQKIIPRVK